MIAFESTLDISPKNNNNLQRFCIGHILRSPLLLPRPLNACVWANTWDFECYECDPERYCSIKMGNKQTIFTDEQLDAYQVSVHECFYFCVISIINLLLEWGWVLCNRRLLQCPLYITQLCTLCWLCINYLNIIDINMIILYMFSGTFSVSGTKLSWLYHSISSYSTLDPLDAMLNTFFENVK